MKNIFLILILSIGLLLIFATKDVKTDVINTKPDLKASKGIVKPSVNFAKIPLYFITNQGQVNKKAKFYAKASRYTLWLTSEGLVFDSSKRTGEKPDNFKRLDNNLKEKGKFERDISRLMFLGANKDTKIVAIKPSKLKVNYFLGNDQSKWHTDVPTTMAVLYKDIYKHIDLKVYGIEKQVEYDWIVKPGGNPENIKFEYKNVMNTRIDKDGNLIIKTKFGELVHKKPISYQDRKANRQGGIKAERKIINVRFKKLGINSYGFKIGEYDKNQKLIIDPLIVPYSSYLGGSGSDKGHSLAADSSGNVYVTGRTSFTNFPIKNQYQVDQTGMDAFVTKIDTTQSGSSSLVYSSYLGGDNFDDGNGIAADNSGNAYVTGYTDSTDYPTKNHYMLDPGDSSYDGFVTKIDTTKSGSSSLVYSSYLGGSDNDYGLGIAAGPSGNVYVTGITDSTDFPNLNQYQGDQTSSDAFVTRIDTTQSGTASLIYSTYLGGDSSVDWGYGIAADNSGNVFVTGYTGSTNFPTKNQYQGSHTAGDAFVTRIDTTQSGTSSLVYSTYLGGNSTDQGFGIAVDSSGNAYVTGYTDSTDFPTLNQYMLDPSDSDSDAFVTKLDTAQSGTSSLVYSSYLGGGGEDKGNGIDADSSGNVYVTGYTVSTDFPTFTQYQGDQTDEDAFVTRIDTIKSGTSSLIYSTYLGGSGVDKGTGIAVDSSGNVYVSGYTYSTDFPKKNQYQGVQGSADVFITKITLITIIPDTLAVDYGASDGLWRYDQSSGMIKLTSLDPGLMTAIDIDEDGQLELAVDFIGYGLYIYDAGSGWTKINSIIPDVMTAYGNYLACDYGASGIWHYNQNYGWSKLNSSNPSLMEKVDIDNDGTYELAVGFPGFGLYYYDNIGGWSNRINAIIPDAMTAYGNYLACDYGTLGLWRYNQSGGWLKLSAADPGIMEEVDIDNIGTYELAVGFPGYGLYYYDNVNGWSSMLSSSVPDAMTAFGNSLACDYGTLGIWRYTQSGGMVKLNSTDPGLMEKVDIDNNGTYELAVYFSGIGLYYYDDVSGWSSKLSSLIPDTMIGINN